MHVMACNEIYYIVLQCHYMSLHRGGFADGHRVTSQVQRRVTGEPESPRPTHHHVSHGARIRVSIVTVRVSDTPTRSQAGWP